jgi:hypothetical protein
MKKLLISSMFLAFAGIAFAQNTAWTTTATSIGLGTASPSFPFHLHGTTDYWYQGPPVGGVFPAPVNKGISSRLAFTTSTTGSAGYDGTQLRQTGPGFIIENLENSSITLTTGVTDFTVNGVNNRAYLGNVNSLTTSTYARLNIISAIDNGLYIQNNAAGYYGLSVKTFANSDIALQVKGASSTLTTFQVKGNGETKIVTAGMASTDKVLTIYSSPTQKILQLENSGLLLAREIKVNALSWADYVFAPAYKLMPLQQVEAYIKAEKHLPNVPSEAALMEDGINVAEMNRILMEKVEELTLYMIDQDKKVREQEARIAELETTLKGR